MFNLEQSITDWRRQMLAAGIKTPEPLDELELHLREDIERQTKSGLRIPEAFEISVQRIGQPQILKREFKKIERSFMIKTLVILSGFFVMLVGTGLILPALAKYRDMGYVWNREQMTCFLCGIGIVIVGLGATMFGFRKRKA